LRRGEATTKSSALDSTQRSPRSSQWPPSHLTLRSAAKNSASSALNPNSEVELEHSRRSGRGARVYDPQRIATAEGSGTILTRIRYGALRLTDPRSVRKVSARASTVSASNSEFGLRNLRRPRRGWEIARQGRMGFVAQAMAWCFTEQVWPPRQKSLRLRTVARLR
jgi:hypothetical protein